MTPENKYIDEFALSIETLCLPHRLVFIDVNGTLIPEDEKKPDVVGFLFAHMEFKDFVDKINTENVGIGLCSDSPTPQLKDFAQDWNLGTGPVIAENGNIISYGENLTIVRPFLHQNDLKKKIIDFSIGQGWQQTEDVIATEFGGDNLPDYKQNQWAFGANRFTSISVFAGEQLISSFGELLKDEVGVSVDCSPQYQFLGVHPGKYKENKGWILGKLATLGYDVTMIGNSTSDWVDPSTGVKCGFVGGSTIPYEIAARAAYRAKDGTTRGVMAILYHLFL